ncbi:MAG TPA: serine hydrolase domain-containing protein, partial [Flavobacterium sp.]|nr:serine hydrolase domain-containing protein [Flavobacterium sp.]
MTNSKTFLICLLISLTNVITINAQVKATPKPKTSDAVDQLIAKYAKPNEPGIAVSVIKDGAIVYKKGVGIANLEYGIPITTSTVFHVASVSKQFTVFSILLLEQDGKLSLDDDIRKYLPEMPNYGNPITLRNLANHTSGIRDNTDLAYLIGTTENDLFSNEQAVKLITSQKGLNFIPGEEFEYCNSGYILLAEIVKRVSGQSFSEFTETRIFKPLKMKNSVFLDNPEMIVKNKAYSYFKQDTYYKSLLNFSFVGSTGLNTTVEDLSLWALNFENKTIGNNIIFDKMNKKSQLNSGEIINYALGQETKNYKGLNVLFHGGGDAG